MEGPRFENLGAETFQRFCQSLLTYEAPDLQALEVGQPDGGRDAFERGRGSREAEAPYGIFQVKFVRAGKTPKSPEDWVAGVIKSEAPKIDRLISEGASSYRLITNAVGSSHSGVGAVDRVSRYLADNLPIPADCWWRNDLKVRLAKYPALRWAYPDLLTPTDILKELIERPLGEDAMRRTNALQAFLIAQHKAEKYVRFKQVDLQHNELLNLFIDVPASVQQARSPETKRADALIARLDPRPRAARGADESAAVGAATLLFDHEVGETLPHVVIEGAPGQGKSTLAQYLCQVHRMRLLKRASELQRVPTEYRRCPLRLPFKIELRDFASFLQGDDPFKDDPEWGGLPENYSRSLEGYLACLVLRYSGGATFNVSDLQAVLGVSYLLIVFDGLDEVAEFRDRRVVVDAIKVGSERLEGMALGLQTVVTSRPAVFSQSPGFSATDVPHLHLVSITKELAFKYSSGWSAERGLSRIEARDIAKLLEKQLGQPHIRELARNPMQLAILLTLIRNKGESLPDKRTDLYTSYLDIFFDREAAKADIVREHRDILLALHKELAWRLHSDAEVESAGGTISQQELEDEVRDYLRGQNVDAALADELFKGMVERIFALVSRVQGRFEFEVQPLREYFAASYLYSTAQVSRLGHERPGTLLDRFDGLARNPYWLNVTRFYAGFYETGQLPSLVYRLKALQCDPNWVLTERPRMLAAMLLGDWSFALDRDSREDVIDIALDGFGARQDLTISDGRRLLGSPLSLPLGAGKEQLSDRIWKLLDGRQLMRDRELAVESNLRRSADPMKPWLERIHTSTGPQRTRWLRIGWESGLLSALPDSQVDLIWDDDFDEDLGERATWAVGAGMSQEVEADEEKSAALLDGILADRFICPLGREPIGWFGIFGFIMQPYGMLDGGFSSDFGLALAQEISSDRSAASAPARAVKMVVLQYLEGAGEGLSSEGLLDRFLESSRSQWGDRPALHRCAAIFVAAQGRPATRGSAMDLMDETAPLLARYRYARARGGAKSGAWWTQQLESASDDSRRAVLAGALSWPTKEALSLVMPVSAAALSLLDFEEFRDVCDQVARMSWHRGAGRSPSISDRELSEMEPRLAIALAARDPQVFGRRLFRDRFRAYTGKKREILDFALDQACQRLATGERAKLADLAFIRRAYRAGAGTGHRQGIGRPAELRGDVAKEIVSNPDHYPLHLVQSAEYVCGLEAGRGISPLKKVAKREKWFAA